MALRARTHIVGYYTISSSVPTRSVRLSTLHFGQPQHRTISTSVKSLAGHSHWANIKHKKGRKDEEKMKKTGKITISIVSAVRAGGSNPEENPQLALLIDRAKAANISKDKIEAAIARGEPGSSSSVEDFVFEATFPSGIGMLIEAVSDSKNRTLQDVKLILSNSGGTITTGGFVRRMFDKKGIIEVSGLDDGHREPLEELAFTLPVDDILFDDDDGMMRMFCAPKDLRRIKESVQEVIKDSSTTIELSSEISNTLNDSNDVIEVDEGEEPSIEVGKKKKAMKNRYEVYMNAIQELEALPEVSCVSHNMAFIQDEYD